MSSCPTTVKNSKCHVSVLLLDASQLLQTILSLLTDFTLDLEMHLFMLGNEPVEEIKQYFFSAPAFLLSASPHCLWES